MKIPFSLRIKLQPPWREAQAAFQLTVSKIFQLSISAGMLLYIARSTPSKDFLSAMQGLFLLSLCSLIYDSGFSFAYTEKGLSSSDHVRPSAVWRSRRKPILFSIVILIISTIALTDLGYLTAAFLPVSLVGQSVYNTTYFHTRFQGVNLNETLSPLVGRVVFMVLIFTLDTFSLSPSTILLSYLIADLIEAMCAITICRMSCCHSTWNVFICEMFSKRKEVFVFTSEKKHISRRYGAFAGVINVQVIGFVIAKFLEATVAVHLTLLLRVLDAALFASSAPIIARTSHLERNEFGILSLSRGRSNSVHSLTALLTAIASVSGIVVLKYSNNFPLSILVLIVFPLITITLGQVRLMQYILTVNGGSMLKHFTHAVIFCTAFEVLLFTFCVQSINQFLAVKAISAVVLLITIVFLQTRPGGLR